MRSAQNVHLEFSLWSNLRRKAGGAVAFIVCGSIAGASGLVMQMAGHELNSGGGSVVATMPLSSTTLSTVVSPASPAVRAPDSRQVSASPSSPQPAPLNAIATAVPASTKEAMTSTAATESAREATTELPQQPVAASKKSQKVVRSPNQRNQGWYDSSAWRRYAHERPSSSW
jgi:hypothetical protein